MSFPDMNVPPELIEQEEIIFTITEADRRITKLLTDMGFRQNLKGFHYIRDAIKLYMNCPCFHNIDMEVYSKISAKYGVTTLCVEHGIRYAINTLWYKNELNIHHPIFLHTSFRVNLHPTNSELIAGIAEVIRMGIF